MEHQLRRTGFRRALIVASLVAATVAGAAPAGRAAREERASPDTLALGERVLSDFCLSCHSLANPRSNPLKPKLSRQLFGTQDEAYRSIGRLQQINPKMVLEFGGTDEERRALAAVLAKLANESGM